MLTTSPDEFIFWRALAEFSASQLPERIHALFIKESYDNDIVGHNSRDSTAIEAREKPIKKEPIQKIAAKWGRPKQGEERVKPLTRIEKQARGMSLTDRLNDLPTACDEVPEKIAKVIKSAGQDTSYPYDVANGGIPISAVLTSAATHDSQVAIPLAKLSSERVINLYDVMDSACDVPHIHDMSRKLGPTPFAD